MDLKIRRFAAMAIDYVVMLFVSMMLVALVTLGSLEVNGLSLCAFFGSYILMVIFKDLIFKNQSVGKRIVKLKIVSVLPDKKIKVGTLILRSIPMVLFPIEFFLIIGNYNRLGDLLANTSVVDSK